MKLFLVAAITLALVSQAPPLENTNWLLVDLRAGAVVTDSAHYVAAIKLTPAGHALSGNSGCNSLAGGYTLGAKHAVKFSPFTGTANKCPRPFVDEEKAFLDALKKTTNYQISGTMLTLMEGSKPIAKLEAEKR